MLSTTQFKISGFLLWFHFMFPNPGQDCKSERKSERDREMRFVGWYMKIALGSAMVGAAMELFMIHTGFCSSPSTSHLFSLYLSWTPAVRPNAQYLYLTHGCIRLCNHEMVHWGSLLSVLFRFELKRLWLIHEHFAESICYIWVIGVCTCIVR